VLAKLSQTLETAETFRSECACWGFDALSSKLALSVFSCWLSGCCARCVVVIGGSCVTAGGAWNGRSAGEVRKLTKFAKQYEQIHRNVDDVGLQFAEQLRGFSTGQRNERDAYVVKWGEILFQMRQMHAQTNSLQVPLADRAAWFSSPEVALCR
jgi:hypothetical protein